MRRFTISLLAGLVLILASVGSALGHVHLISPLNCSGLTTENVNAGASRTEDGPADSESGGPLFGQIPTGTGSASFTPGLDVAGRHSALCP
jgi:hypothetical protein